MIANLKALKGRASLARLGGWRRLGGLAQRAWFISNKGLQTFSTEAFFVESAGAVRLFFQRRADTCISKTRGVVVVWKWMYFPVPKNHFCSVRMRKRFCRTL